MPTLLIPLDQFPHERDLVARMILAYGELEFCMLDLLAAALDDTAAAVRTLYQLRSEANRHAVVEAIAQPSFARAGLAAPFKEAMDAVKHCKGYRNQYAHCHWTAHDGILHFTDLEVTAKSKGDVCKVQNIPITLTLLRSQWAYFEYTDHLLLWLDNEFRIKAGLPIRGEGQLLRPKRLDPPKKHSRGEPKPMPSPRP